MIKRTQHPSPWYRTKSFYHNLFILNNVIPPSPANHNDDSDSDGDSDDEE